MIFFDIDNTLIDQRRAERAAAAPFLAEYGELLARPLSIEQCCRHWQGLREKHNRDFLRGAISAAEQRRRRMRELFAPRPLSDAEADRGYEFFQNHYRAAWRLYDDVLPCLRACAATPLGIISNGSTALQRDKLSSTGVAGFFSLVVISDDVGAAKPAREIFLEACRRARRHPEQCVYVGDRFDIDALASRAAGMRGIWLNRKARRRCRGGPVLHSLAELAERLRHRAAA